MQYSFNTREHPSIQNELDQYVQEQAEDTLRPKDRMRAVLLPQNHLTTEQKSEQLVELFYTEYGQDREIFAQDVYEIVRDYSKKWAENAIRVMENPRLKRTIRRLQMITRENADEYKHDIDEFNRYFLESVIPQILTTTGIENIIDHSPCLGFLQNALHRLPNIDHLTHDYRSSHFQHARNLLCSIEIAEKGNPQTWVQNLPSGEREEKQREFKLRHEKRVTETLTQIIPFLDLIRTHNIRILQAFITELTGKSGFEDTDAGQYFGDLVTMAAVRTFKQITPYNGNEEEISKREETENKNRMFIRIDPKLQGKMVKMDPNNIFRYFWNAIKNASKEIGEEGWLICDVRLSQDGKYVLIEVTDSGPGFQPMLALKSAEGNMRRDPSYESYLKANLPGEVVDTIKEWGNNPYAIRRLTLRMGDQIDMFLLERISGKGAAERSGSMTSGIGLASMRSSLKRHNGTVILTNSPFENHGAKILTILPVDPDQSTKEDIGRIRGTVEERGLEAIYATAA